MAWQAGIRTLASVILCLKRNGIGQQQQGNYCC